MKHLPFVLAILLALGLHAQDKPHSVKQITARTQYVGGNDMGQEIISTFSQEGIMLTSFKRGYGPGGVVTHKMMPSSEGVQHRWNNDHSEDSVFIDGLLRYRFLIDLDSDTLEHHTYNTNGERTSTYHIYSKPHKHSVSIAYKMAKDGSLQYRTLLRYNKKGLLSETRQFSLDEELQSISKYQYDKYNNCTKRTLTYFEPDGSKRTSVEQHRFSYDAYGNWTRCEYLVDGRHYYTITREILYW